MPESLDPFVSTADLSDILGRDVEADPGAAICVDAACDIVRDAAGQTFNQVNNDSVTLDGTGTDALLLPESPVSAVDAVSVRDSAGSFTTAGTADYSVNGDGILFATNTCGTATFGTIWPRGRQNIHVTYDHGYTLGASGTLPRSVRMIALTVAQRLLVQGPTVFESLGDQNIRYAAESTALMPTERMILRKYRRAR
jgi:hypothetical protein